ncbi:unnamed protein product [Callosobruchus maculatus]|uniref:Uncharacterized protein n=1 Tax=Callosobruchus maculatus TaxID=64391 RepID=A0A653BR38_CALMS|nr:unnamed protein product [Callosobruchus maculatus]
MPRHRKRRRSYSRSRDRDRSGSRSRDNRWWKKRLVELQHQIDAMRTTATQRARSTSLPRSESRGDSQVDFTDFEGVDTVADSDSQVVLADVEGASNLTPPPPQVDLEEEVQAILGAAPSEKPLAGPPIHATVVSRWSEILAKGLDHETRVTLMKDHPIPENFSTLKTPALNAVVVNAVSLQVSRRDAKLMQKQEQLASCISAIGTTISSILQEEGGGNRKHLQLLSDAGRLLCDFHHSETVTRQGLITVNLNKDLKETLKDSPSDDFLFGTSLEERLKTAKQLVISSKELMPRAPVKVFRKTTSVLNSSGPARQTKGTRAGPHHSMKTPSRRPQPSQAKRTLPQDHRFRRPQDFQQSRAKTNRNERRR